MRSKITSISFINQPPFTVASSIQSIFAKTRDIKLTDIVFEGSIVNRELLGAEKNSHNILIWEPKANPGCTCFTSTFKDGWQTLIYAIQRSLQCLAIRFIYTSEDWEGDYIADFEYLDSQKQRRICVYEESRKYFFFQSEQILPFEDGDNYKKRKIKERLTREIIESYLGNLGIKVNNELLFQSDNAMLIS